MRVGRPSRSATAWLLYGAVVCAVVAPHLALAGPGKLRSWSEGAAQYEDWIIQQQEHLHTIPELLFDTPKTYARLTSVLTELGIENRWRASLMHIVSR